MEPQDRELPLELSWTLCSVDNLCGTDEEDESLQHTSCVFQGSDAMVQISNFPHGTYPQGKPWAWPYAPFQSRKGGVYKQTISEDARFPYTIKAISVLNWMESTLGPDI